jgi:hypothetical protein
MPQNSAAFWREEFKKFGFDPLILKYALKPMRSTYLKVG